MASTQLLQHPLDLFSLYHGGLWVRRSLSLVLCVGILRETSVMPYAAWLTPTASPSHTQQKVLRISSDGCFLLVRWPVLAADWIKASLLRGCASSRLDYSFPNRRPMLLKGKRKARPPARPNPPSFSKHPACKIVMGTCPPSLQRARAHSRCPGIPAFKSSSFPGLTAFL